MNLIDVRVLGSTGVGYTSDAVAGIDWAVANRSGIAFASSIFRWDTRFPEPAAIDPLCQAVARAVQAGVVVIASAGNYGVTSTGAPVLGGIRVAWQFSLRDHRGRDRYRRHGHAIR